MQNRTKLLIYLFLWYGLSMSAQIINKGDLYVSKTGSVKIMSPFFNKGAIYNDGLVSLSNDFNNTGVYDYLDESHSILRFESNYTLKASGAPLFIASVEFNLPYLMLSTDLYIDTFSEFNKGIVESVGSVLSYDKNAGSYSNNQSFFTGLVEKLGTGYFTYPIGKQNVYAPLKIDKSASESVYTEYFIGDTDKLFSHDNREANIIEINPKEYWNIEVTNNKVNIIELSMTSITPSHYFGLIDQLSILYLDKENNTWIPLNSELNNSKTGVMANLTKSGVYTLGIIKEKSITNPIPTDDIMVYQGITANNDGANDYLTIKGIESIPDNKITIFNRTGQEIYSTKNYGQNGNLWYGTYNGTTLNGTYFYVLKYVDGNGNEKEVTGFIHVK